MPEEKEKGLKGRQRGRNGFGEGTSEARARERERERERERKRGWERKRGGTVVESDPTVRVLPPTVKQGPRFSRLPVVPLPARLHVEIVSNGFPGSATRTARPARSFAANRSD